MKILYIVLILSLTSCTSRNKFYKTCNIEFMNTYLERCQEHCGYEDDGYNCSETCLEAAEARYCN